MKTWQLFVLLLAASSIILTLFLKNASNYLLVTLILSIMQVSIDLLLTVLNTALFISFINLLNDNAAFMAMKVPVKWYFSIIITLETLTIIGYCCFVVWFNLDLYEGNYQ
jgi:hypothetical protein